MIALPTNALLLPVMVIVTPGGNGDGDASDWVLPVFIAVVVAGPVIVGLILRIRDRRADRAGRDSQRSDR